MEIRWRLKSIKNGDVIDISKSVFKVGRDCKADLISTLPGMSRRQATFSILVDGELYVVDHKSLNGTFVNGLKIPSDEPHILKHKDRIGFGCCQEVINTQRVSADMLVLIYEVIDLKAVQGNRKDFYDDILIVKDEPACPNDKSYSKDNKSFSQDEDLIIISDDEDESAFASSQLFELSEKVKNDQVDMSQSYDPYSEIKQELQDLDACELANFVPVDLTDEFDHFESTEALVDILETPRPQTKTTSDLLLTLDNATPHTDKSKNIIETSSILANGETDIEFCNNNQDKKNEAIEDLEVEFHHKDRKKKEIEEYISKTPKHTRPPIIEPHSEVEKSLTSKESKSSKEINRRSKRKSTLNISELEEKKRRTSESTERHSLSDKSNTANPFNKADIKEARKQKLKEIAVKNSPQQDVSQSTRSKTKTMKSEEIYDLTGNDKLSPLIKTDGPKKRISNVKAETVASPKPTELAKNLSNIVPKQGEKSVLIKNDPRTRKQATKTDLPKISKIVSYKKPEEATQTKIQDNTVSSNNMHGFFKSVSNSRGDLMWQSHLPRNANIIVNHYRHLDNNDEYVRTIVNWSFKWIKEQLMSDVISPPVSNHTPVMVPATFSSIQSYKAVFEPLVFLELWQTVYRELVETQRKHIQVHITHERRHGDLLYLDCDCFYSEKDFQSGQTIRPDDFTLFEVKCKDTQHTYQFTGFAFIKHSARKNNAQGEGSKSPNFQFTLITRELGYQISGDQLLVLPIRNVSIVLKLLNIVKYLDKSPLCQNVLSPDAMQFQLPTVSTQLEIQSKLNPRQKEIVCEARHVCLSDKPRIYLINGPPGTGKSTVIINIILEVIFNSLKVGKSPLILLTAPSNTAVDGLIMKLANTRRKFPDNQRHHLKIVRTGPDSSISSQVSKFKLSQLAQNNLIKEHKVLDMPDYKKHAESGTLSHLLRKKLGNKYQYEMKRTEEWVLFNSNVICTTLNSCVGSNILRSTRKGELPPFTCCIIDEATQCNELESLLPLQLGVERFILVGDPMQLPAVVNNKQALQLGYGRSLFSRIAENFKAQAASPIKMLNEQYRMLPEICEYPNKAFYHGQLKSLPSWKNKLDPPLKPYLLFNLTSIQNNDSSDYVNTNEAHLICKILDCLKQRVKTKPYSIGIISPYRAQTDLLRTKISSIKFQEGIDLTVNTVDSFQGMENDVIIISCVRANNNNFLQNVERLNVALTRAKQALYIVGNYSLFKECKPLYDLRENAKKRKLCLDIKDNPKNIHAIHKIIFQ